MKNRKRVIMFLMASVMVMMCGITTYARENQKGSVTILLTDDELETQKEKVIFEYIKVAELVNGKYYLLEQYENTRINFNNIKYSGEMNDAALKLDECVSTNQKQKIETDENGKAFINDLEVGIYLFRVSEGLKHEKIYPTLISIPTWDEEQGDMNYDITMIPKRGSSRVTTGDARFYGEYMMIFAISLIILIGLTCHNRFKCGRISDDYSVKGVYTRWNDNDTKKSRRTR